MAEGGGLLNRYTLQRRIEGSNPSVSASFSGSESHGLAGARKLIRWGSGDGRVRRASRQIGQVRPVRHVDDIFIFGLSREITANQLKINQYLSRFGTREKPVLDRSRLRVFYATLARKAPSDPVGRALRHCLEVTFR